MARTKHPAEMQQKLKHMETIKRDFWGNRPMKPRTVLKWLDMLAERKSDASGDLLKRAYSHLQESTLKALDNEKEGDES